MNKWAQGQICRRKHVKPHTPPPRNLQPFATSIIPNPNPRLGTWKKLAREAHPSPKENLSLSTGKHKAKQQASDDIESDYDLVPKRCTEASPPEKEAA
ncbi:unnamed protein product, partial [Dovyalis caffra]